jgi:DNA-binding winged helix-turn-helix (wHTH) protein/tetratricopeptide (TPR) repeat protein
MVLAFGPFELDVAACELRRDGKNVPLQPRVFDTLRYLVEHRDRLVSKQELIDALWGGQQLNAVAVPWSISHARKALGQHGEETRFIETVRGRGYRFVADVSELARTGSAEDAERSNSPAVRVTDPFVGREQVMLQLSAALEASRAGRGSFLLLTGEPGIGKTRCASEFAALARARGISVWSGRCFDEGAPAFWPLIQVLREASADATLADTDRGEAEHLLEQLVPGQTSTDLASDADSGTDDARFWLLDRLSRFFARSATTHVRIVSFDDLHGADESSLRALSLLAPLIERTRLLVLGTARDTPADLERGAAQLSMRLRPCERITLSGLLVQDVEHYLTQTMGEIPAAELSQAVHARTAGNPLFVREAVRLVRAEYLREGHVRAADVRLPEAAKGFVNDRLAALEPPTRAVLDAACVIGDEFELAVLQRVTELPAPQILASLHAAEAVRIVESKPDGLKHSFAHPLMREGLYSALPTDQRALLHARVGLALEALAVIEPRLNQLAYHFHHAAGADHFERAVRYGRLAGDAAMRVFAYDEAVQFYAWALEAQPYLKNSNTRTACDLLLASAGALLRAGRRHDWRKQCKQAIALARQAGLADLLVQAARQLRPSVTSAQVPDGLVVTALEEALSLLPESSVAPRALAYARLASIPPYSTDLDRSRQMSDEAVRLARASGEPSLILEALRSRFRALSGPDTMDELLRVSDELLGLEPRAGTWWSADALVVRYQTLMRRGDVAGADRALAMFGRASREMRVREWAWHYERLNAQRALAAGRLDEAERHFNQLWTESQRLHLPYGGMLYAAQLNALSIERTGQRLTAGISADNGDPWAWAHDIPVYRTQRLLLSIQLGERDSARENLRALAANSFAAVTRDGNYLFAMARLAQAAVMLEERPAATKLYELLQPYAALFALSDFSFSLGSTAYYLGILARFLDQPLEARRHFETAVRANSSTGHELFTLHARHALAQLLADSRARLERAQALALATEVRAAAQRFGLNGLRAAATVTAERLATTSTARLTRTGPARSLDKTARNKRLRMRLR